MAEAKKLTADWVKNLSEPPEDSVFCKDSTMASAVSEASAKVWRYSRFRGLIRLEYST